jgi:hypothetical protein
LAAEQGDASAQLNLGNMYANGYGVTKDHAEAVLWWLPLTAFACPNRHHGQSCPRHSKANLPARD